MLTLPFRLLRHFARIAPGSYLAVEIHGRVVEIGAQPRLWELAMPRPMSIHGLHRLVDAIAEDDRIRGITFILKSFHGGLATASSLRGLFARVRALGREVVVSLPQGGGTKELYIAAGADRVFLGPHAGLASVGFLARPRYLRRALDKAGLVPEVYAAGKYKSAGESLVRESMSDANREQIGALLDGVYREVVGAVAVGRKLDEAQARAAIDGAPYLGEEAVAAKLVDGAAYEDELPKRVGRGNGTPEFLDAQRYLPARTAMKLKVAFPVPFIGVIPVHGPIAPVTGGLQFGSMAIDEKVIASIRAARKNPRCLGVILHVDSPGGSALASDRIHHELEQLAKEKPLIACMGNVAASGGYYVAAPAHLIVAQPTTITGSIGVVAARVVVAPLLSRLGVATEELRRGERAGLLDPTMPWGEAELEALQREIGVIYRGFVDIVARGRKRDRTEIEKVAEGRVWTGSDALTQGLVDRLGSIEDTVGLMRARVGESRIEPRVVRGPKHSFPLNPPDARKEAARAVAEVARSLGIDVAPLFLGMHERVLAWSQVDTIEG